MSWVKIKKEEEEEVVKIRRGGKIRWGKIRSEIRNKKCEMVREVESNKSIRKLVRNLVRNILKRLKKV